MLREAESSGGALSVMLPAPGIVANIRSNQIFHPSFYIRLCSLYGCAVAGKFFLCPCNCGDIGGYDINQNDHDHQNVGGDFYFFPRGDLTENHAITSSCDKLRLSHLYERQEEKIPAK